MEARRPSQRPSLQLIESAMMMMRRSVTTKDKKEIKCAN